MTGEQARGPGPAPAVGQSERLENARTTHDLVDLGTPGRRALDELGDGAVAVGGWLVVDQTVPNPLPAAQAALTACVLFLMWKTWSTSVCYTG